VNLLEPEPSAEQTESRTRRLIFAGVAVLIAIVIVAWYVFRFTPEKRAAERFFDALVAGDTGRAYELWKGQGQHSSSYTEKDFLEDWGPNGYYGPVKSYRIESASSRPGASGVDILVDLSPYAPFPAPEDVEKSRRTRRVRLWVETKDKSLSFPP
jgi:hypothetical protein